MSRINDQVLASAPEISFRHSFEKSVLSRNLLLPDCQISSSCRNDASFPAICSCRIAKSGSPHCLKAELQIGYAHSWEQAFSDGFNFLSLKKIMLCANRQNLLSVCFEKVVYATHNFSEFSPK